MAVSPPRPKGPPLNALRAFEAAARLGGFALAAEELCVTPGAVSQHIKTLENWTGTALFERRSHGVRLTRAGARLLPGFTAAFDQLGQATRTLRSLSPDAGLQIAALPAVAQLWLSPRLGELRAARPGARVSVTALENPPNLKREMFDLSVFIGKPTGASNEVVLEPDVIFPVCTPHFEARLSSPTDLLSHTLLFDAVWPDDWALWSESSGTGVKVQPGDGPSYSLYAMALEEACAGTGILMAHGCLVAPALDDGTLVRPFDISVPTGNALILTFADGARDLANVFNGKS